MVSSIDYSVTERCGELVCEEARWHVFGLRDEAVA